MPASVGASLSRRGLPVMGGYTDLDFIALQDIVYAVFDDGVLGIFDDGYDDGGHRPPRASQRHLGVESAELSAGGLEAADQHRTRG